MSVPDFSKYDETQLKQVLTRIDRRRFPERAKEIEDRLAAFKLDAIAPSRAQKPMGNILTPGSISISGSRAVVVWILALALLAILVAGAISIQRTSAARQQWFEDQAQFKQHAVVADAVIVAKSCAGRTVRYSWTWGGKQFQAGGWSCNSTCTDARLGDKVQIRFLPTNPGDVRCESDDIESKLGPPNYLDPILFVLFVAMALFAPFIRLCISQTAQKKCGANHSGCGTQSQVESTHQKFKDPL